MVVFYMKQLVKFILHIAVVLVIFLFAVGFGMWAMVFFLENIGTIFTWGACIFVVLLALNISYYTFQFARFLFLVVKDIVTVLYDRCRKVYIKAKA